MSEDSRTANRSTGWHGWHALTVLLVSALAAGYSACAASATQPGNRLIQVQQWGLYAYFEGHYWQVKRADFFYGYGWLDDHRVFVAYEPEGEVAAYAILEVIDLRTSKTTEIKTFGATGEPNFDINPKTHQIVCNFSDGIKILTIDSDNKLEIMTVAKDEIAWAVFWIDDHTIGYFTYRHEEKEFMTLQMPG